MAVPAENRPPIELRDIISPSGTPSWQELSSSQVGRFPFTCVGQVKVNRNGGEIARGTCWLASNNTAVTAAHVVTSSSGDDIEITLTFSGSGVTLSVSD